MTERKRRNEGGTDQALAANVVSVSLHAKKPKAFLEWLDASKAWSDLRQAIEEKGEGSTARRELRRLERRLNAAADAYKEAQRRLGDSPLYAVVAGEEGAACPGLVGGARSGLQTKSGYRTPNRR